MLFLLTTQPQLNDFVTFSGDIQIRKLLKNPDNVEEKIASQNISLTRDDLETLFNSSLNITEV